MLARVESRFYRGFQTAHTDKTVAVFFQNSSSYFRQIYNEDNINKIIRDVPVNLSEISSGARVIVESGMDYAVPGTVVYVEYFNKSTTGRVLDPKYNLTVQLDANGKTISVTTRRVWLLPYQLENKGKSSLKT